MQPPKNAKEVWAFLGLVGYYQKFIKNFASIAKPVQLLCVITQNSIGCWITKWHSSAWRMPCYKYPYYTIQTLWNDTQSTQMPQTMPVVLSYHRDIMVKNYQSHFFHTHSWTLNEMENSWTRGLWCLLYYNTMELLSPEIWNHHAQWPQTFFRSFSMARTWTSR